MKLNANSQLHEPEKETYNIRKKSPKYNFKQAQLFSNGTYISCYGDQQSFNDVNKHFICSLIL